MAPLGHSWQWGEHLPDLPCRRNLDVRRGGNALAGLFAVDDGKGERCSIKYIFSIRQQNLFRPCEQPIKPVKVYLAGEAISVQREFALPIVICILVFAPAHCRMKNGNCLSQKPQAARLCPLGNFAQIYCASFQTVAPRPQIAVISPGR